MGNQPLRCAPPLNFVCHPVKPQDFAEMASGTSKVGSKRCRGLVPALLGHPLWGSGCCRMRTPILESKPAASGELSDVLKSG